MFSVLHICFAYTFLFSSPLLSPRTQRMEEAADSHGTDPQHQAQGSSSSTSSGTSSSADMSDAAIVRMRAGEVPPGGALRQPSDGESMGRGAPPVDRDRDRDVHGRGLSHGHRGHSSLDKVPGAGVGSTASSGGMQLVTLGDHIDAAIISDYNSSNSNHVIGSSSSLSSSTPLSAPQGEHLLSRIKESSSKHNKKNS